MNNDFEKKYGTGIEMEDITGTMAMERVDGVKNSEINAREQYCKACKFLYCGHFCWRRGGDEESEL